MNPIFELGNGRGRCQDGPGVWLGLFLIAEPWIYFPLWYPALIFALAGVAALWLGRRFTIRSAIIATTVLAVLLGMAVAM